MNSWAESEVHMADVGGVYIATMIDYCQSHPDEHLDGLEIDLG